MAFGGGVFETVVVDVDAAPARDGFESVKPNAPQGSDGPGGRQNNGCIPDHRRQQVSAIQPAILLLLNVSCFFSETSRLKRRQLASRSYSQLALGAVPYCTFTVTGAEGIPFATTTNSLAPASWLAGTSK